MAWTNEKQQVFEILMRTLTNLLNIRAMSTKSYIKIVEILQAEADENKKLSKKGK